MLTLLMQIIGLNCGPECPYASESSLYESCTKGDDCGCVTVKYASNGTVEESVDLKCHKMKNFKGETEKICTASCIDTKNFSQLYDQDKAPGCTLGKLSSAKSETGPGGLSYESRPLTSYVENSVCAFLNIAYDLSDPPRIESGLEGWYAPHDMYCIPYEGFAVEGEPEKSYEITP
ncbi:MAG TPA: hypothetical protein VJG31_01140 [Candidatus Nanoarchaeia archaeon]|nr:hypothetical protein [Candidatus Nanoarchaeia archaeon]